MSEQIPENQAPDNIDYYYVTYSAIGIINGAGVIMQRKRPGFDIDPEGFSIASASQYLFKLMEVPCIIQSWTKITKKRVDELNKFSELMMTQMTTGLAAMTKDNVSHLRLVPTGKPPAETTTPPDSLKGA